MKLFGKKKKNVRKKAPKHVRMMRLGLWQLVKKSRLREKTRMANEWAGEHKGSTATATLGLLSLSLLVGIMMLFIGADEDGEPSLEGIASVSPMFNGMRRIQENKNYEVSQVEQMTMRGKEIKQELDSLIRIPLKSHDDSVQIVIKYKQLEMIVRKLESSR